MSQAMPRDRSGAPPSPRAVLERHFGFRAFLDGQEAVIRSVLSGTDTLVVLPTGGGKSLCYQLPALLLEGQTVVVSPLIALMKDQVDALAARGIPAAFINSSLTDTEIEARLDRMARGEFRLVYVAPERFKSPRFMAALGPLSVALFAVDEAHCISQWGHDFRPDYLRLKQALAVLGQPTVLALTATATPEVRADIVAQLALGGHGRRPPAVFVTGFARPNLAFAVTRVRGAQDKLDRLTAAIRERRTGIVYCATRRNVERCARALRDRGLACVAYHGGLSDDQRTEAQARFMSRAVPVAVATNAFGMGIDRPDLRFVLHADVPELLFNYADVRTQEFFIEGANPTRDLIAATHAALIRLGRPGPIRMSIAALADAVGTGFNDMGVATALYLLERAGFIRRGYEPGSRTYTTELVEPERPLDALDIDFQRLDAKRERDELKLKRMLEYAGSRTCRQYGILNYFGDAEAESLQRCGRCDRCRASAAGSARLPADEEALIVQKALCAVGRLRGRFGRGRIAQVLVGSRAREVLDAGLDRLPTYGALSGESLDFVWNLLDALVAAGCIEIRGEDYPTASLTPSGLSVARGAAQVPIVWPERRVARPGPAASRRAGKPAAAPAGRALDPAAAALFARLKAWRRRKAAAMGGVPAYVIYPDATLRALAEARPRRPADLLSVQGIGPAKVARYGRETLALLEDDPVVG